MHVKNLNSSPGAAEFAARGLNDQDVHVAGFSHEPDNPAAAEALRAENNG